MAFNWEQSAFLGYMVEEHNKAQGKDLWGNDLYTNDNDDDYESQEEEESNLPWWER